MRFVKFFLVAILLFATMVPPACFGIQQTQPTPLADEIAKLRDAVKAATDLDETSRTQIENSLKAAELSDVRAAELASLAAASAEMPDVAAQQKSLQKQLDALKQLESAPISVPADTEALVSQIKTARDRTEQLKKQTLDSETDAGRRAARREEIRTRMLAIDSDLPQLETQLTSMPVTDTSIVSRSKRLQLTKRKANLTREAQLLQDELSRFEAEEREDILRLQRELTRAQLAQQQNLYNKLDEARAAREKKSAADAAAEAKKQQEAKKSRNPTLAASYEENTVLARQNEEFVSRSAEISNDLTVVKERLDAIQRQFTETDSMIEQVGLSGSVGSLLRQRKSDLPNTQLNLNKAREIKREVEAIQFQLFDINRRKPELTRETIEAEILASSTTKPINLEPLDEQIKSLLAARQEILSASQRNVRALFDKLVDMEFRYRTLANVSQEYRQFLNERIFWIKSNKLLFSEWKIDESDKQILRPKRWKEAAASFGELFYSIPLPFGILLFATAGLIALRPRLRSEIRSMSQMASRGSCASFWPTMRALFATLLLTIATPLPLLAMGIAIQQSPFNDGRSLFSALGYALIAAGLFALPVEFLRHVCRNNGLAQKHLAWSDEGVSVLKRNLGWLSPLGTVIVFAIALLQRLDATHRVDLAERLLFVAGMFWLYFFLRRILSPTIGIFREYLQEHPKSWVNQTSALWYLVLIGLPVLMALLAVWGYYYTTSSLVLCAFSTFVFAVIVEMLRALLQRFILVQRRHAHIESAKRKREADRELRKQKLQAQQQADVDGVSAPVLPDPLPEMDPVVDIDENAVEATRLIGLGTIIVWAFGLWIIWADVLPALKALDEQPIFPGRLLNNRAVSAAPATPALASTDRAPEKSATTANEENSAESKSTADTVGQMTPGMPSMAADRPVRVEKELTAVTYGDLLLFLVITAITIAAARSLPSTLEMIFLNQLPLDRSVRYATKSLFSYAIVLIGMVLAFRALSISWSNVQWLATALTFGLAFGLQEIFANFVAGIILMFERPMRIGDWITIDEFTGMVTKIRTRATTIVNLERKEFVIPNKDFITGRLVNWTLSDAINRVDINVGIAYGSDVDKAKLILLQTCQDNPRVVSEPAPSVIFSEFGDSSLNLILRAFLKEFESRMPAIDEFHTRINRAFNESGIEISFPQRDLHLRSVDPGLGLTLANHTEPFIDKKNKVMDDTVSSAVKDD